MGETRNDRLSYFYCDVAILASQPSFAWDATISASQSSAAGGGEADCGTAFFFFLRFLGHNGSGVT
jgi:hypothetical protein